MKFNLKFGILIFVLLCNLTVAFAQQLNTPKEFQDIMKYSPIEYFNEVGNQSPTYEVLKTAPFSASISTINGSKTLQKALKKGDKYYKKKKWNKALHCYQKVLGIDKSTGSLEVGKHADLIIISGHPADPRSRIAKVLIEGRTVFDSDKTPAALLAN